MTSATKQELVTTQDLLARLIAFPTVSRDSNLALIDFVREYLERRRVPCRLTFDDEARKANLYATIGPEDLPGVCLSGHTDVVPVEGQDWTRPPFELTGDSGRLYGRGVADMKGFLAVVLGRVDAMLARPLRQPIHLAFSYDEEVGCLGVQRLLADLAGLPVRPGACIVGEPTLMRPVNGHKGKHSLRCHVRGLECHSALAPRGVNAVETAAEMIAAVRAIARRLETEGPFDPEFDPPHSTAHVGRVEGGTALNIVPRDCWFEMEFRYLPGDDPDVWLAELEELAAHRLVPEMRAKDPETGIAFDTMTRFPGLATDESAPVAELARALTGINGMGKVSFGTEAGRFSAGGIPAIVCGPGSIEQAHKPDEWIDRSQLAACEGFVDRLIDRLAA